MNHVNVLMLGTVCGMPVYHTLKAILVSSPLGGFIPIIYAGALQDVAKCGQEVPIAKTEYMKQYRYRYSTAYNG